MKKIIIVIGGILSALLILAFPVVRAEGEGKPVVTQIEKIPDEIVILAKTVSAEANTEGYQGQRLVCSVILNRVESIDFPNTIESVISQDNQFATYPTMIENSTPSSEVWQAVNDELAERTNTHLLYFRTNHYHGFGTPALKYKNHYFSSK